SIGGRNENAAVRGIYSPGVFVCLTVGKQRLDKKLGSITNILSIDYFFRLLKLLIFYCLRYCVKLREFSLRTCHNESPFLVPPFNYLHSPPVVYAYSQTVEPLL